MAARLHAAIYLKTGHPSLKVYWDAFVASPTPPSEDTIELMAKTSGATAKDIRRAIFLARNGMSFPLPLRPAPINQTAKDPS